MHALTNSQVARANRAFQLLAAGDGAGALAIAEGLRMEAPSAPDALHLWALSLSMTGAMADARDAFKETLALAPKQPVILANFARFLRQIGQHDDALVHLRNAVEYAPTFAQGWLELGQVALGLNQLPLATTALERAVALDPSSPRAWHLLGSAKRDAGDYEEAEAALRSALKRAPQSPSAWANLGATLRLLGRSHEALECLAKAEQFGAQEPEVMDTTVGTLTDIGELEQALKLAGRLVDRHPSFVSGHVTRAHLQWEYGSGKHSLEEFRSSAEAQSDNDRLQVAFIGFLLGARHAQEALDRISSLRRRVDDPVLMTYQANALELLDRSAEAAPLYAAAHQKLGDKDPAFLNAYVRHLLTCGEAKHAAQLAQDAVRLDPNNQEALAYLATAWRLLGDEREHWLCKYERDIVLLDVPPPTGYASVSEFLTELEAGLLELHKAHTEPVIQSLRKGSQTPGRLFGRPVPVIDGAQSALRAAIEQWLSGLDRDELHPFRRRHAKGIRFTGSWSVRLRSHGNHVNHIHPQGWISSAYYVSLPPSVKAADSKEDQSGHIQFGQPPVELGLDLPARRVIKPEVGKLALFPSYMWHGTVPFDDEEPRITIAFDMIPRA